MLVFTKTVRSLRAARRLSRRLLVLDVLIDRQLWTKFPWLNDCIYEVTRLLQPRHTELRISIRQQLNLIRDYSGLPLARQQDDLTVGFRILQLAHRFLCENQLNCHLSDYRILLLQPQGTGNFTFSELRLALQALELACLLQLSKLLYSPVADCADRSAVLVGLLDVLGLIRSSNNEEFLASILPYESSLIEDPAQVYPCLDSNSKNMYRRAVERIAENCDIKPQDVIKGATELAMIAADPIRRHVGFYFLDDGLISLLAHIGAKWDQGPIARGAGDKRHLQLYYFLIILVTFLLIFAFLIFFNAFRFGAMWGGITFCSLLVISSEVGNDLADLFCGLLTTPKELPRLEFDRERFRSEIVAVAVPTLLTSEAHITSIVEVMEQNYISAKCDPVVFVLLTDYPDSDCDRVTSQDRACLEKATVLINYLNLKYGTDGDGPFVLLHRERRYSDTQARWVGWERKRGKLRQLNKLLLNKENTFDFVIGSINRLALARFVLVLDDNSKLSQRAIPKLLGIALHPLNTPIVDENDRLMRGFPIFQPLPAISAESARRWRFASSTFKNIVDERYPPTRARSVHFELFSDCMFFGKGLYEVQAFERLVNSRIPDESVLSHDILEGGCARTASIGDVVISETCPSSYRLYYERLHRWARGDWQNLATILVNRRTPFSSFSKYMVVKFVRRTLFAPARTLLLLSFIALRSEISVLPFVALSILLMLPDIVLIISLLLSCFFCGQLLYRRRALVNSIKTAGINLFVLCTTSLHHGIIMIDAISRTICRVGTGRNLLAWKAASVLEDEDRGFCFVTFYLALSALIAFGVLFYASKAPHKIFPVVIALMWCLNVWLYFGAQQGRQRIHAGSQRVISKSSRSLR